MRILLIEKNGQLGWELQRSSLTLGEIISVDYPEIDLSNSMQVCELIRAVKPKILINAAAYTNVDKAESEPELARKVNALAPEIMALEMNRLKGALIHYSTDYVFDGTKGTSYVETDLPNPINVYGSSKLEGEQLIQQVGGASIVFRTSCVYSMRQGGFVTKVLQWAREQEVMKIVDDQIGSPTWARMLAEATTQIIAQGGDDVYGYFSEKAGLFHLAGNGSCSRYDWAKAILELDPKKNELVVKELLTAKTSDFSTPAVRPLFSSLDCTKIIANNLCFIPDYKNTLAFALNCNS